MPGLTVLAYDLCDDILLRNAIRGRLRARIAGRTDTLPVDLLGVPSVHIGDIEPPLGPVGLKESGRLKGIAAGLLDQILDL